MIRYIKFKNFRSLTDITFDFTEKNGIPKPLFILYGENGSGKSNFISGFELLLSTFRSFSLRRSINEIIDKEEIDEKDIKLLRGHINITQTIHQNKTIDSEENMSIELGFLLKSKPGTYYIEFDNEQIVSEKLDFTITQNKGCYFSLSSQKSPKLNTTVFSEPFISELDKLISRYWGKFSLMSFIYDAKDEYSKEFLSDAYTEAMSDILKYFQNISTNFTNVRFNYFYNFSDYNLLPNLVSGNISENELHLLNQTQSILNIYYTGLYKDIVEIYYKTEKNENKIHYTLYVKKNISGKILDIDFRRESQGTKTLLNLLQPFLQSALGGIAIIDEIDNGIHDVLLTNLIKCIQKNNIDGQLIFTTHNSLFIDEYDLKDYIYFIDFTDDYQKSIKAITDYDFRIQPGTRILYNYLQEKFARLPWREIKIDFKNLM